MVDVPLVEFMDLNCMVRVTVGATQVFVAVFVHYDQHFRFAVSPRR